jgi:acetolactate synthase-1/2/3 large subunit
VKKTGADIFVESLKREGVKHLFGYPGGVVLPIFDSLHGEKELKLIMGRHEQGIVHAADGYARATGKPGVALVTSGPGATNTVTAIATAYMDSIPLVVFTGQVSTPLIGNDAFQEADIIGITRPCTKYNILVKDTREITRAIREAFFIATSGRPGPVVVDLPKDILQNEAEFVWPEKVELRGYQPTYVGHPRQIAKAARMMA